MRAVRQTDTSHEIEIRRSLFAMGYRFRVNLRREGTRIDIAFPGLKVAVFCDGCFWHGCPSHATRAKHNAGFWDARSRRTCGGIIIGLERGSVARDGPSFAYGNARRAVRQPGVSFGL